MQIKSFSTLAELQAILEADAVPKYFSRVTISGSTIMCYIGESLAAQITTGSISVNCNGQSVSASSSVIFSSACITDNAIAISAASQPPFLICKNEAGDAVICFFKSDNYISSNVQPSTYPTRLYTATCLKSVFVKCTCCESGDNYIRIRADSIYNDDGSVVGVWMPVYTPYPSHHSPFRYTFGGVGYVGTYGNNFMIRSE